KFSPIVLVPGDLRRLTAVSITGDVMDLAGLAADGTTAWAESHDLSGLADGEAAELASAWLLSARRDEGALEALVMLPIAQDAPQASCFPAAEAWADGAVTVPLYATA
ncbi:hypothetical protein, partial [Mangrovicoccus sp. HB161399]|uniref:hypothetical protein n=1 Tax=Mangrovicoccus sp. HB161399 TaxID=2720392 RepID=UPI0015546E2C